METVTGENKAALAAGWGKEDVRWETSIGSGEERQSKSRGDSACVGMWQAACMLV